MTPTEPTQRTTVRRIAGSSPDSRRPWFARLYHSENTAGQPAIAVTNYTRDGLQMDIDVGIERDDIALIEWGGSFLMATSTEPIHDEQCEAEFVLGAGTWTDCGCLDRRNTTAVATSTEPTAPAAGCNGGSEPDDDEYADSLLDVEPETPARRMTCRCFVTPESEWVWDSGALAYEPACQCEQNPDCPVHGVAKPLNPDGVCSGGHPSGPRPYGPCMHGVIGPHSVTPAQALRLAANAHCPACHRPLPHTDAERRACPQDSDSAGTDSGAPASDRTQGAARTVGPVANHRSAGGVAQTASSDRSDG